VAAAHYGVKGENNVARGPASSDPTRQAASRAILARIDATTTGFIAGGDLNALAGSGPQDHDDDASTPDFVGSTAELDLLSSRLTDAFDALTPAPTHCSNKRIDFVFFYGPYVVTGYDSCRPEAAGSDHPFVLVTLEGE
jgi:endonuclease/exonuclease/phosphatase family metal-dependent hydrolase